MLISTIFAVRAREREREYKLGHNGNYTFHITATSKLEYKLSEFLQFDVLTLTRKFVTPHFKVNELVELLLSLKKKNVASVCGARELWLSDEIYR